MKIGGFQRFSLLDYPGQLAAIIFTQGCNFRCPYCHNPKLVEPKLYEPVLNTEWVLRFLYRRRKKLGAVVISGGEPTLQDDLIPFLKVLKAMRFKVKLDTNGSLPDVLAAISQAGLVDYLAMDLKAPLPLYKVVSRSDTDAQNILDSMDIVRRSGVPYEFRTTFFDALLSVDDIIALQALLTPGDKFIVQECRYGQNLEIINKPDATIPFMESPICQSLVGWGKQNSISVSIRSL